MSDKFEKKWNIQYKKLVEFKRHNGHCLVPHNYEHDKSLGDWVSVQRTLHKNNKIRPDRKRILDEIGFAWKDDGWHQRYEKLWHQQYEKLVEFKRTNGHCRVPRSYEQDKSLGPWVSTQRACHKNNKLGPDRKIILDEIGFVWKDDGADRIFKQPNDKLWHQQYKKLVEFERKNGHCLVPNRYKQDASLGLWVSNQRKSHTHNKMRRDRKELLDALDFVWNGRARAVRSSTSTTDVRGLVIGSFHALGR
jgi:uncharacterized protein YbgA (DUF1722 family)